jgi:biotin carboxylase
LAKPCWFGLNVVILPLGLERVRILLARILKGRAFIFYWAFMSCVGSALCSPDLHAWPSIRWPSISAKDPHYVVIVEPISSGNQLAAAVRARGLVPIAVRSDVKFSPRMEAGFHPEDFLKSDIFNLREQSYPAILASLRKRKIDLIIPGSEMGVSPAYLLARDLGTESNSAEDIRFHRDKFSAQAALWENGIEAIPSAIADSEIKAREWVKKMGGFESLGRVVIKPRDSHGGDLVQVADTIEEVEKAVRRILETRNASNLPNREVLLQKFIYGDEYAINGAVTTVNGKLHIRITDVWRYYKTVNDAGYPQYGHEKLLAWNEIPFQILELMPKILEALRFKVGAFHSEIKITPDKKAVMIETAARLYGAGNTKIAGAATNYSQINATLDSYLNKKRFVRLAGRPYRRNQLALVYNINTPPSDVPLVASDANMQVVRDFLRRRWWGTDLFKMVNFYQDGQTLEPTNDLLSTFGEIEILVPDDLGGKGRARCEEVLTFLNQVERSGRLWSKARP